MRFRLTYLCLILLALVAVAPLRAAAPPDPEALVPELFELDSFYFRRAGNQTAAPEAPSWLGLPEEEVAFLKWHDPVAGVGSLRKYDLSRPPRKTYWWNYPLYGLFGFPKDMIDGFYGVVGKVPPFNLMITGLTYEVVPMQLLVRKYKDWHRWPGRANKHGHGWVTAPNGWGFFPNYNYTKFRPINEKKLEEWRQHNAWVDAKVAEKNKGLEAVNREATKAREQYLEKTRRMYDRRQYRDAIRRLWVYLEADPRHRQSRAMLIASLVAILPNLAERAWAEDVMARYLRTSPQAVLVAAKEELERIAETSPENEEAPYYLVWVDTRLRAYGEAYQVAKRLTEIDPANVKWQRLRFETALRTGAAEWIDPSVAALEASMGAGSQAAMHARGRVAFQRKQYATAQEIYRRLRTQTPGRARYQYLYGMALVREGMKTGYYDRRDATAALRAAMERASSEPERIEYEKALRAAKALRVKPPEE